MHGLIIGDVHRGPPSRRGRSAEPSHTHRFWPSCSIAIVTEFRPASTAQVLLSAFWALCGFVALWLEYGHAIVTHAGRDTGKKVAPSPFMRRAFDSAAERALEAFTEEVRAFMQEGRIAA